MRISRREFVASGAAAGAWALSGCAGKTEERPMKGVPPIRVGLVGCGGRGRSAAENCLSSAPNVELVALADLFEDRLEKAAKVLAATRHPGVKIDPARCFSGFEGFRKLLECGVDLVLLATPPGFRPLQFAAAVEAGKHSFLEKPAAVDPVGVRAVIEAGEKARRKNLAVVAGTQYRHQKSFVETIRRIREGAIGEIRAGRIYYNTGATWSYARQPGQSDAEWQIRNWKYFDWLSGDHIVEQHVHTVDVMCWVLGGPPAGAVGVGGRQVRVGPEHGNIYDHFGVDYEYGSGLHVLSLCRQMADTAPQVGAYFVGTKGEADVYGGVIRGARAWSFEDEFGERPSIARAYVQEHADLIESIRAGEPLNEARQVAESTLAAILGREAAYTGKALRWEEMVGSDLDLAPPRIEFGPLPVRPVPLPGKPR
jgi:predicted dehydrogenase